MSQKSRKTRCAAIALGLWAVWCVVGLVLANHFGGLRWPWQEDAAEDTSHADEQTATAAAPPAGASRTATPLAPQRTETAVAVTQTVAAAIQAAQSQTESGRWGVVVVDQWGLPYADPVPGLTLDRPWRVSAIVPDVWRAPEGALPRYEVALLTLTEPIDDCVYTLVQTDPLDFVGRVRVAREQYMVMLRVTDLVSAEQIADHTLYADPPGCPIGGGGQEPIRGAWPEAQIRAWLIDLLGDDPSLPEP